ncbi:LacI family DNA-binding transcriptional regulator [Rodentibacter myodis]|uniref:Transcriptional regulator n=1 Tax=Rodentibacter myodis TaxID=1907939 RepID=A0A1V3JP10_9PAST|nr:LacI family DNA-binding transcriptional regulator [Rodentibacter myodis]OOF58560.1 transcriptional regulator [Rodentibacter myodis]
MVSLKDVADLAGVSMMTVSRAINNPNKLSEKTYQTVKQAIDQLGYVPNFAAQNIRGVAGKTIGVLSLGTATTPFSVEILLGIERTVRKFGWHSYVINAFENDEIEMEQAVEQLVSHRPNAIIIARNGLKRVKIPEKLRQFPIALANCVTNDLPVASYIPDDFQGQYEIGKLLAEKGYKKPLFLHIPHNYIATKARKEGFEKAFFSQAPKESVKIDNYFMQEDGEDYFEGAKPLLEMLQQPKKLDYDVIVCGNDRIAFVAYQLLLSHGYRIPEDIAVTGYDNTIGIAHLFIPPLTTVELPHYAMGEQAALHLIEGHKNVDCHKLACPLMIGKSC